MNRTSLPARLLDQPSDAGTASSRNPSGTATTTATTAWASAATPTVIVDETPGSTDTGLAQKCAAAGRAGTHATNTATMTTMRRTLLTVTIALGWLVAAATPAAAHSVSGVGATNYQTRLNAITPEVPGVEMRVIETGSRFELTNTTGQDIIVLGYQDEPYLQVGPDGVFENRRSPAVYLNASRQGDTAVPGSADPDADADWHKTSDGHVSRWHDHRIHWMGNQDPPQVRDDPGRTHVVIPEWTITMRMGDQTIEATGDLVWVPGPSPVPWLVLAAALAAGVALLAVTPVWARALAVVLAAAAVIDIIHAVGIGWAKAGGVGTKVGQLASGSFYALVAWIAAGIGVWLLARRKPEGLLAAGFAGAFITLFGGIVDFSDLTRSQVPFAWSATLARLLVAASLGIGVGLVIAAVLGVRRYPIARPIPDPAPAD
ncbi:MAG: hypothetical protein ACRD0G_20665 [Acidimicrobiales bacterium]